MRILILGGDGYLGWPTAMRFSARGHEVAVVDNFARRRWHLEQSTDSLTPILPLGDRIEAWRELSGKTIESRIGSVEDGEFLDEVVAEFLPEVDRPLRPAAFGALLDALAPDGGRDPADQRDRHAQPAVLDAGLRARRPPDQARHDGRVRHPQHRHRRGLHRDRAQRSHRHAAFPEAARARSTTARRSTTRPTSTSQPGSGACGRPTSTRASSTGSRPTKPPSTRGSRPGSTTTRPSAPCSTGSASRRWSAIR